MIITSLSCEELSISSSYLTSWFTGYPASGNLYLTITYNYEDPVITEIKQSDVIVAPTFTINIPVKQGVYSFELKWVDSSGDIHYDTKCFFNECDLACTLAKELSSGCKITHRFYTFLKAINNCPTCDCNYANQAYSNILNIDNPCNC